MLSKEEIAIRVGVDSKGVTKGMVTMNNFVERSLGDVQKKFLKFSTGLAAGYVVGAMSDAVGYVLEKWESGWDKVFSEMTNAWYGFSEQMMTDADRLGTKWKAIRSAQQESNAQKEKTGKTARDVQFEEADSRGKMKILDSEMQAASEKEAQSLRALNIQRQLSTTSEEFFKAEKEYYSAVEEKLKSQVALKSQLGKLNGKESIEYYRQRMQDESNKALSLRKDLSILKDEPGTQADQSKALNSIADVLKTKAEMTKDIFKPTLDSLPDIGIFKAMRSALSGDEFKRAEENVRAQAEAMAKAISSEKLKVSIVEINEK